MENEKNNRKKEAYQKILKIFLAVRFKKFTLSELLPKLVQWFNYNIIQPPDLPEK